MMINLFPMSSVGSVPVANVLATIKYFPFKLSILPLYSFKTVLPFSEVTRQKKMQQNTIKHKMNML